MMAKLINDKDLPDGKWQQTLDDAMLARRVLVNRVTGFSPARLVLGDELVMPQLWTRSPTWQRWRTDGIVRFALVSDVAEEAQRTVHKRRGQRDKDVDTLLRRMDATVRKLNEDDKAADAEGTNSPPSGLPRFRPGDYVRRWLGDGLPGDTEVLNAKLASRRWSTPWRVAEIIRGMAALITKADDPLQVSTVSIARIKRVEVAELMRNKYEKLWRATMEQKEREKERREQIMEKMDWRYEEKDEREMQEVKKVLQVREKGKRKEVKVLWMDDSVTWEPAHVIKHDAPEVWEEWKTDNSKEQNKRSARGVKK